VIGGLYRYVRNPMYLAVVAAITGQALALGQPVLLAYATAVWVTTAAFVRWYEEPALARQFGAQYEAYRSPSLATANPPVGTPACASLSALS
jgi:protein-S-isoprenylcysteine O-methyltransferase Ste14